uniref:Orf110c n=1 Tax=Batis maritima TaxID=4436 RepID=A0A068BHQ4_BATMA|nr:orf110c [Batis maritima]AIC83403.1 orf110c [Batis maritima]
MIVFFCDGGRTGVVQVLTDKVANYFLMLLEERNQSTGHRVPLILYRLTVRGGQHKRHFISWSIPLSTARERRFDALPLLLFCLPAFGRAVSMWGSIAHVFFISGVDEFSF